MEKKVYLLFVFGAFLLQVLAMLGFVFEWNRPIMLWRWRGFHKCMQVFAELSTCKSVLFDFKHRFILSIGLVLLQLPFVLKVAHAIRERIVGQTIHFIWVGMDVGYVLFVAFLFWYFYDSSRNDLDRIILYLNLILLPTLCYYCQWIGLLRTSLLNIRVFLSALWVWCCALVFYGYQLITGFSILLIGTDKDIFYIFKSLLRIAK
ncbi:MAG: hypothetical protein AAF518_23785 [Spirochaetota bacterium]